MTSLIFPTGRPSDVRGVLSATAIAMMLWIAGGPALAAQDADHAGSRSDDDVQIIEVLDSAVRVRLWRTIDDGGTATPHYSISLDGQRWSRPRATTYQVRLRYATFDPLAAVPEVPAQLAASPQVDESIYIVQFVTQPLEAYRAAIRARGGVVRQFVADHAHLVQMTPQARDEVAALPFVRWVGPYHPAYRLEEYLVEHLDEADAFYPLQRYNIMVFEAGPGQKGAVAARIAKLGGRVDRANAGKRLLEATLTPEQLLEVARWNEVLFIDRWGPPETDMDIARQIGGADSVESVAGFTGQGVRGEVIDNGFNVGHVDFASRPLIEHTAVNAETHGSSTSGIVFGDGTGNPAARGMLPDGQGIIADADVVFTGQPRYDHTGELVQAPYFAVFQTASVGSPRTTQYTTISADTDEMLFDFDILHLQSQSNAGNQDSRPQAWAKNIISVGGIRHHNTLSKADDCWNCGATAASIGPAADGRIKPDLCHFYDNIFTVTGGSSTAYTSSFGGTSGATPIVAGHAGLFFQMWSEGIFGNPVVPGGTVFENRPHMTTAKAMLINTADPYPFTGSGHDLTRVHQGWGMPDVQALYDERDLFFIVDETDLLTNLGSITYTLSVALGVPSARFTLTYADPPGVPASAQHRVNDLTLRVTSPEGQVYWGNNGLLAGNWSVPGGAPNTVDTVENVRIQNPEAGLWVVEVLADEINQDSHVETPTMDADFALVASGVQPIVPALLIRLPSGTPTLIPPGTPTPIDVEILDGAEMLVAGSAMLHYRFDSMDPFQTVPLVPAGGSNFVGTLPGASCISSPEFYFSAEGDGGTVVTHPSNAPASVFAASVGVIDVLVTDDFETDQGWTVENVNLLDGPWERGVPVGGGDRGDPATDFDGSGQCFLTDNVDGNSDVDGGPTRLISPIYDLSGVADPVISYARWFTNDDNDIDRLDVEISNDGGNSWVLVESVPNTVGWTVHDVRVSDFVTPTAIIRMRFSATDNPNDSVTEAAIDALSITSFDCQDSVCPADLTGDGAIDVLDLLEMLAAWGACPGCPADLNTDDVVDVLDLLELLAGWGPCP